MMSPIKPEPESDSEQKSEAFHKALLAWFDKHERDLPWRRTRDPYAILVSEMMLQQTQVATVVSYFERWMERFPDIATLATASEADVLHLWQGLGYYARARNLHKAAKVIYTEHKGCFPRDQSAILALPGVGPYTGGAVGAFAFNQPTPPIDANIQRVLARLLNYRQPVDIRAGIVTLRRVALAWQPKRNPGRYHEAMMELGALVCTARSPGCRICPVQRWCAATDPELLPVKKPRRPIVALNETCGWVERSGQVLLEQQTGRRWHGLWRLPLLREVDDREPLLFTSRYPFTHHQVTLRVYRATEAGLSGGELRWFPLERHGSIAMTAPHRRALEALR